LLTAADLFDKELENATRVNYARATKSFQELWADNSQNYDPSDIFAKEPGANTHIVSKLVAWVVLSENKKRNPRSTTPWRSYPNFGRRMNKACHVKAVRAAPHGMLKDADGSYTSKAIGCLKAMF